MLPYRSTYRSPDCDDTPRSCCKHARGGFGNLKKLKIVQLEYSVLPYTEILIKFYINVDEILLTSPWKQEESHCLHDHPPFSPLLIHA